MSEHAVYPNILWCVENLAPNMKKRGPTVRLLNSHWQLKAVVYQSVGGEKVQIFLRREAPPHYCINTYFYTITSACIDDGTRYLEKSMKVETTSTKVCIWEANLDEMMKLNQIFKHRVHFFVSFEPGKDWRNFQEYKDVGKFDGRVSYSLPVLCQDMEKLLNEGIYADVLLRCDGKDFPVHKAILAIRSQEFRNILKNIKVEENENGPLVLDVKDVGADVLIHMLRYIYLAEMPEDSLPIAQAVYEAIQKYKIGCWAYSLEF